MTVENQIQEYISNQKKPKQIDLQKLHQLISEIMPDSRLWFFDGKNEEGKIVSNPNIGYGLHAIKYKDGTDKDFYQIGLSANTSGISIYIMGIEDKKYLQETFADKIGKATVTGYCIKFKKLNEINIDVLESVMQCSIKNKNR